VTHRDLVERYYLAFRERDRESLRALLTPGFRLVSGYGEFRGRERMLDEIWPTVGKTWAVNLRIFGDGPELVALYEHAPTEAAERPPHSMAERFRFEGDRIAEIEVFIGREISAPAHTPEMNRG
jgi:hypothetical protein